MGWTFPWASSEGGDFNFDFNVSFTEAQEQRGAGRIQLRARDARDGHDADPAAGR